MERKQTILIVDDDAVNRKILKRILSDNYFILEAENGAIAWNLLADNQYDISAVLLDIIMPIVDGYALLEKMRQASMSELPTIVMTGELSMEAEKKALDSGAWDFIPKPYNGTIIRSRLRNAIARRQVSVYEKMQKMASYDSLTGLHNRSKMFDECRKMLDDNPNVQFEFIRIDIDHFALYNTSFGDNEGDKLIKYMASCIEEESCNYNLCRYCRMNADIFSICFAYDGNEKKTINSIYSIQEHLSKYRKDYCLGISAGVYIIDEPKLSIEECYVRASIAAQKCKNNYDRHIALYDTDSRQKIQNEVRITNEMQQALDEKQFVVYLQPKINLSTETACGAEALVRWQHPTRGMISPGEFIPVFEQNGFISKLDYYVWEQTCIMLHEWIIAGIKVYPISVNISRISLYNPHLPEMLTELIKKYHLSPSMLQLEITESAYMTSQDLMKKTIHDLHESGFTILMDDFGSGYSSLNTLKDIEVDVLKIDMKFLHDEESNEKSEIILATVVKMANWLGMSTVTEGVETRKQRDFLEGTGCSYVQGYYYSKPIPRLEYESKYLLSIDVMEDKNTEIEKSVEINKDMSLLIIDDSKEEQKLLYDILHDLYRIQFSDNVKSAITYLKDNPANVQIILTNDITSIKDEIKLFKYSRQYNILKSIPIILITTADLIYEQVEAFNEGAYDFITKPFIKEIVLARVKHIIEINKHTSIFDINERNYKQYVETDSSTGLINKQSFKRLSSQIFDSFPNNKEALMMIDIDDFKQVNDNYGHMVGDKIIANIANELTNIFRKTDVIGRFGGDEFVVLMTHIKDLEHVKRKATQIIKSVILSCNVNYKMNVSVSIGISIYENGDTINTMFVRADQALYEAKNTGKSKFVVYGEKVPPVLDDDKPVVLICSENPQLYPAIAIAYGESAAFVNITCFDDLVESFTKYQKRIRVVCLDMQKKVMSDSDEFYQYVIEHGGGKEIQIFAVCKEGSLIDMRNALGLDIFDILFMPPQIDVIKRRISHAVLCAKAIDKS